MVVVVCVGVCWCALVCVVVGGGGGDGGGGGGGRSSVRFTSLGLRWQPSGPSGSGPCWSGHRRTDLLWHLDIQDALFASPPRLRYSLPQK